MNKSVLGLLILISSFCAEACPTTPEALSRLIQKTKVFSTIPPQAASPKDDISEKEFNEIVGKIRDKYTPVFTEMGKKLNVHADWNFPLNNAFVSEDKSGSNVYFFGMFTMNKYMTKDTFLFVACHEIGHHIGGFPKDVGHMAWSSVEGQADYFAAHKCFRELLKNDPKNPEAENLILSDSIKQLCTKQFSDRDDYQICLRTGKVAEQVGKLIDFMLTWKDSDEILLAQPVPAPVQETSLDHPSPVCRSHAIVEASLCNRPTEIAISETDETIGVCHPLNGDEVGARSRCWFKPQLDLPATLTIQ